MSVVLLDRAASAAHAGPKARGPVVAFMLLALAACGQSTQAPAPEAGETAARAPAHNVRIGFDGAAGINAALPMNVDAIAQAAPAFLVREVADQIEGQPFVAITLSSDGEEVFRAFPTSDARHIHSIVTVSTAARGPNGETIGTSTYAQAPRAEVAFCGPEFVEGTPGFACSTAMDGRFWRVYKLPAGYDGPSDPFDAIDPDYSERAVLSEMRWIAPRVG